MDIQWVIFVVTAAGLTALVFYSEWLRPAETEPVSDDDLSPSSPTVACPRCGAVNDRSYTYCSVCVAELSIEEFA